MKDSLKLGKHLGNYELWFFTLYLFDMVNLKTFFEVMKLVFLWRLKLLFAILFLNANQLLLNFHHGNQERSSIKLVKERNQVQLEHFLGFKESSIRFIKIILLFCMLFVPQIAHLLENLMVILRSNSIVKMK